MSEPYPGWVKRLTVKCRLGLHEYGPLQPFPGDDTLWVKRCYYCGKRQFGKVRKPR